MQKSLLFVSLVYLRQSSVWVVLGLPNSDAHKSGLISHLLTFKWHMRPWAEVFELYLCFLCVFTGHDPDDSQNQAASHSDRVSLSDEGLKPHRGPHENKITGLDHKRAGISLLAAVRFLSTQMRTLVYGKERWDEELPSDGTYYFTSL